MREMKICKLSSFGAIPFYWKVQKLKTIMTLRSEKNSGDRELLSVYLDRGVISYSDSTGMQVHKPSQDLSNYQNVHIGDFVLNNQQAWRGSVGISKYNGIISPAYFVYRLSQECYPRYMNYLFRDFSMVQQYETSSRGVGTIQRNIFAPWLLNCWTIIPPYDEQIKIANYLDISCTEIDTLIVDIQAQIDVLEQYKRSIITETVTKGLNPNAEMKDSGVPWIGMMPAHWDCIRGKYILEYLQKPVKQDDEIITCFRDGEVTLRSNRREDGFTVADKEIGYQGIDIGDLVVHGMDGFAGAIGVSDSRGKASPVLNVLDTEQDKRYIMYFLRSMAYSDVFLVLATGIRVRSCDLRWNKLSELTYPIPPLVEQKEIVEYIDAILQKVDAIVTEKKKQLETLDAYKKSLIFEYVTGKKEIPETLMAFGIDPHVLRLAIIVDMIKKLNIERKRMEKKALKGKVVNQKFLYLLDEYLEHGLDTRYHRYQNGPFDLRFDSYINTLVSNGWYELDTNDGSESLVAGRNHTEFLGRYGNQLAQYKSSVEALTRCFGMMSRRQLEEVATLFAVWNDLIIDGNLAPSNDQIINEAMTNWTPNKGKIPHDTWQSILMKMKRDGIIPKGLGLHTLPKPEGGKSDA